MIPVVQSKRFTLRGFTFRDFQDFVEIWNEPEVARYIPFAPLSEQECWVRYNQNIARWIKEGFGQWSVADQSGKCVGVVGFFENKIPAPEIGSDADMMAGWVLSSRVHQNGVGTEVVRLMHDWLDRELPTKTVICGMDKQNKASIRLAEKNSYHFLVETLDEFGEGQLMLRKPR